MRKRGSEEEVGCPVAALIDVVFLLIVFFLVTANVEKDIVDRTIELAQAEQIKPAEKKNPRRVLVNLHADGSVNIAKQPLSLEQLKMLLYTSAQQYGNTIPVVIRADASTRFREIDKVMDVVGQAGLYRVQIAAVSTME